MASIDSNSDYIVITKSDARMIERLLLAYEMALDNVLYKTIGSKTADTELEKVRKAQRILDEADIPRTLEF